MCDSKAARLYGQLEAVVSVIIITSLQYVHKGLSIYLSWPTTLTP